MPAIAPHWRLGDGSALQWCEGASCLVAFRRVSVASTLQLSIIHAAPIRGASCHRPCGGGLRGGGLFISVPFVVVCLMALTIHVLRM